MAVDPKYIAWTQRQYNEIVNIDDATTVAKKYGDPATAFAATWQPQLGSIWRQSAFYDLRYHVIPDKGNYYTSSFKLQYKDSDVIYAIMYSTKRGRTVQHEYCCLHHTFASMDGEFRRNFIRVAQIDYVLGMQPKLTAAVEAHFLRLLAGGKYIPHCETIGDAQGITSVNESIDAGRWPIKLLIAHWIATTSLLCAGDVPSHISQHYTKVFLEQSRDLYDVIVKFKELALIRRLLIRYSTSKVPTHDRNGIRLGQKYTIPSLTESREPMDISHSIWREIYIAGKVSALVINGIAAGVPLLADWFMIAGCSPMLFDNDISHLKLKNSERGIRLSKHVAAARGYTFRGNDSTQLRNYYSAYMEQLDDELDAVQDLAEEHTVLSNEVICQVVEDVGFTWGNLIQNMDAAQLQQYFGPIFGDVWMFSRYLFDILYTLLALNDHCGVLQGDLHHNNATFYLGNAIGVEGYKKPRIMYRVGDKLYVFPHYGRYACVIDYSRALLDSAVLNSADISADIRRRAVLDQHARALGLITKFRPEYAAKHKPALVAAVERDFTGVWQVLRVVDALQFCTNIRDATTGLAHDTKLQRRLGNLLDVGVLKRSIQPMLGTIIDFANAYLDSGLRELVAGEEVRRENPNATIIARVFAPYELGRGLQREIASDDTGDEAPTLVDYLAQTNTLRYSTTDPDNFPPLSRLKDLTAIGFIKLDPGAPAGAAAYKLAQATAGSIVSKYAAAAQAIHDDLRTIPRPEDDAAPDTQVDVADSGLGFSM